MERREPDFGAVAQKQEYEGEVEERRIEAARLLHQRRPHHRVDAFADDRLRGGIDEDGAEERQRDADRAEDEIFPRRFERRMRAIDADHHDGRKRRDLDRNPHQADIVGDEREVHREHQRLVHGVVETQMRRRQPADLHLVRDVACAEHAGREADEGGEHDEDDVQIVDEDVVAGRRPQHEERQRAQETWRTRRAS